MDTSVLCFKTMDVLTVVIMTCREQWHHGVNYGTLGNNLLAPTQVAQLLLSTLLRNVKIYNADKGIMQAFVNTNIAQLMLSTLLWKVKIYNVEKAIMQAFVNTNIKLVVGMGTESIPLLASSSAATQACVQTNIAAYMLAIQVSALVVGNEVFTMALELVLKLEQEWKQEHWTYREWDGDRDDVAS